METGVIDPELLVRKHARAATRLGRVQAHVCSERGATLPPVGVFPCFLDSAHSVDHSRVASPRVCAAVWLGAWGPRKQAKVGDSPAVGKSATCPPLESRRLARRSPELHGSCVAGAQRPSKGADVCTCMSPYAALALQVLGVKDAVSGRYLAVLTNFATHCWLYACSLISADVSGACSAFVEDQVQGRVLYRSGNLARR